MDYPLSGGDTAEKWLRASATIKCPTDNMTFHEMRLNF
jgi:hypothetical protein